MDMLDRVKLSRERLQGVFPYPDAVRCIRYAITELAEYDDALLRLEYTGDKRNHDKQPDPRKELGQAMYMLLSALGYSAQWMDGRLADEVEPYEYDPAYVYFATVENLCQVARDIINDEEIDILLHNCAQAWEGTLILCMCHRWDAAQLVEDTCADFERKHLGAHHG
jgi:hypothetical protein